MTCNDVNNCVYPNNNYLSNNSFDWFSLQDPTVATAVSNGSVAADCWRVAWENSGVTSQRINNAAGDGYASDHRMRITKTGGTGKIMVYQVIEETLTRSLCQQCLWNVFNGQVSTPRNMTGSFIGWNGTANVVSTSPVSSWTASGGIPVTLAANFTELFSFSFNFSNTGSETWGLEWCNGDALKFYENLIFAWFSDTAFAPGAFVDMTQMILSASGGHGGFPAWIPLHPAEDLGRVQRQIEKTYDMDTAPGTVTTTGAKNFTLPANVSWLDCRLKAKKVKTPTITFYNPNSGASGSWRTYLPIGGDLTGPSAPASQDVGQDGFGVAISSTDGNSIRGHYVADASL